ncbi:hypothetical protein Aperf_G00000006504 [Anoplocephala perfoliata]
MHCTCALREEYRKETLLTIVVLTELRVLDVSKSAGIVPRLLDVDVVCAPNVWKHLTTLDLSGNAFGFTMSDISQFIQKHPNLTTIGLTGLHFSEAVRIRELSRSHPNLMVIGDTGDPLVKALTSNNVCRSIKLRLLDTLLRSKPYWYNSDVLNMSKAEKTTITTDSECLKFLFTVIVNHLPQSTVKTLLPFSNDYFTRSNSNSNFDHDHCWRVNFVLQLLHKLIKRNSDACQTFAEHGGAMIVAAVIQVCSESTNGPSFR